ncbi:MaoC/PaaZ C-terminal domain-containing protein [Quadrisphaera oryzae]|uniref:MaoC/PaaZ C-terminal domain-containing protein n=1 Tax=Quadrisphaera TaxID=317661 RepID=UPI001646A1A3|nr:MaoC family dehydratase N-terminal domain-containing protein [Quadrisphaera sp. RL12-1S]
MSAPKLSEVSVGDVVGSTTVHLTRADLLRYADASGDHNPIHASDEVARSVGLPGVIAHGMLTMGAAVRVVVDWAGDPGAVVDYGTRFTGQVPVDAEAGADLEVTASVGAVDAEAGTARVDIAATCGGTRVLGRARAVVRLPA